MMNSNSHSKSKAKEAAVSHDLAAAEDLAAEVSKLCLGLDDTGTEELQEEKGKKEIQQQHQQQANVRVQDNIPDAPVALTTVAHWILKECNNIVVLSG